MKNIWKKIGKQQNCVKHLSPQNKIQTIDGRKSEQNRKKYFSPSRNFQVNKRKNEKSQCFKYSQDSSKSSNLFQANSQSDKIQRYILQTNADQNQKEIQNFEKQYQLKSFFNEFKIRTIDNKSYQQISQVQNLVNAQENYNLQQMIKKQPPYQNLQTQLIHTEPDSEKQHFTIIKQVKESGQKIEQSYQSVEVIEIDQIQKHIDLLTKKENQKQPGILVRINSRSREQQKIFFELVENHNDISDSYIKSPSSKFSQPNKKNQNQMPQKDFDKKVNLFVSIGHQTQINELKPLPMQKSKMSSNSIQSGFSELKKSLMRQKYGEGDQIQQKSEKSEQPQQIFQQESIEQVIELESEDFTKTLNMINFTNSDIFKLRKASQMSQPVISSSVSSQHTEMVKKQIRSFYEERFEQRQLLFQQKIQNEDVIEKDDNQKGKRKINLAQNYKIIWGLNSSGSILRDSSHQRSQIEIKKQNQNYNNKAYGQQQQSLKSQKLSDSIQMCEFEQHLTNKQGNQTNNNSLKSQILQQSKQISQQSKQISHKFEKKQQQIISLEKDFQDVKKQKQKSSIQLKIHENHTQNLSFNLENFSHLQKENVKIKKLLKQVQQELQKRDQDIYALNQKIQKLKSDCLALRVQLQNLQKENQAQISNQLDIKKSLILNLEQDIQQKDHIIEEKQKQNQLLYQKITHLNSQILSLNQQIKAINFQKINIKEKTINKTQIGSQTQNFQKEEKELQKSLTCYFKEVQQPLSQKKQVSNSVNASNILIKGIPTLSDLNNAQNSINMNQRSLENSGLLNLSIQLNLFKNKRLLLTNRQSLLEIQQYIFDLQQKITVDEEQFQERLQKELFLKQTQMKGKYSSEILLIKQQLQNMKTKYDKLKLLIKNFQKEKQKEKEKLQVSSVEVKDEKKSSRKQEKSNFDEMIKNVTDFQRLFVLFNEFNQKQSQKNIEESQFSLKSPHTQLNKKQKKYFEPKELSMDDEELRSKEDSFERMNRQISKKCRVIERFKMKCLAPQNVRNVQIHKNTQNMRKDYHSPCLKQRQILSNRHKNRQLQQNSSSPAFNQNQNYSPREFYKQKFTSLVRISDQQYQQNKIQGTKTQKRIASKQKQTFKRYQSPQTDRNFMQDERKFGSEYGLNDNLSSGNFRRSKSPKNLLSDHGLTTRRQGIQSPRSRGHKFLRENKVFEDKKDLSYISSKLSKLQKDINLELRSIKNQF